MIKKENLLEAWIMVEHLSEGDINLHKSEIRSLDGLQGQDFYSLFLRELSKPRFRTSRKSGIAIYFDTFSFNTVIDILRKQYKLKPTNEELKLGNKFSFALYFDNNLNFQQDMTFFTESAYIRYRKKVPHEKEFQKFEEDLKKEFSQYFEDTSGEPLQFNSAMLKILRKYNIDIKNCWMQPLKNIESDATNLHSFFINDLQKAKTIDTPNLNAYLFGTHEKRINLDSNKTSENFNPKIFEQILQPKNYPLGRFPSNTAYALSFMQQVAVNLAIGADSSQIRSVNGPPGTGKTTLLKDIFAQLIVKQAYDIAKLPKHFIKGTLKTIYFDHASIGMLPEHITENSIVVASSNNGAVQNIVNELPLKKEIDQNLLDELMDADYFYELSNSRVRTEWKKDEDGKRHEEIISESSENEDIFWGLFSLEGGKADNMSNILNHLKMIYEYLDQDDYLSDEDIYEEFLAQYEEVENFRKEAQKFADSLQDGQKLVNIQAPLFDQIFQPLIKAEKKLKTMLCNAQTPQHEYPTQFAALLNEQEKLQQKKQIIEELKERYADASTMIDYILARGTNAHEDVLRRNKDKILDMTLEYEDLQMSNPWFDEKYRIAQSKLFIMALRVRKQFLYENKKNIKAAAIIWNQQEKYLEKEAVIKAAWNWINMAIPVISSTFASFSRMCKYLKPQTLGHLFIDEAGQALPQAAVGAIYRSRHVMVVGDPSQIKPVLTLDSNSLQMLGTHFGINEKYLSDSASVQTLVDTASQYGFYRNKDQEEDSWIGIPLWVHRRCQYPMFTISNIISYDGLMVQGMKKNGKAKWFDISGKADNKYVKEQGDFLLQKIREMIKENPKIIDKTEKDIIYVITPFTNVAFHLSQKLKQIDFTRYDSQGKPSNIGTVHTFQGKEAPVVFFVLGADWHSNGAARWAMSESNIMNVAVTRAKEEFYIIGDRKMYLQLGCDVATDTEKIIRNYNKDIQKM